MAVVTLASGEVTVNGQFIGNINQDPSLLLMSEAELLERSPTSGQSSYAYIRRDYYASFPTPEPEPLFPGPGPGLGGAGAQDSGEGFAHDPWIPHDPDPDWHPEPHGTPDSPEYGQPGFYDIGDWFAQAAAARPDYYNEDLNPGLDLINTVTQPIIDTFPDWEDRGGTDMGMSYGVESAGPSMCKLALMNKALIAIVQAGAVTSAGNPLLGVVGSILSNGLQRLGVGRDWGQRIFGSSQDADVCQRIVEEAIAIGYLRIPKPNANGSLPANMQITLDPDSPRATLQWRKKSTAGYSRRRAPVRRAAPRRSYRRRAA